MIIKLALLAIKKIPKAQEPAEQALEQQDKIVHVSRPDPGKLKSPIRLIQ